MELLKWAAIIIVGLVVLIFGIATIQMLNDPEAMKKIEQDVAAKKAARAKEDIAQPVTEKTASPKVEPLVKCSANASNGIVCTGTLNGDFDGVAKLARAALQQARNNKELEQRGYEFPGQVILYIGLDRSASSDDYDLRLTWRTDKGWFVVDSVLDDAEDSYSALNAVDIVGVDEVKFGKMINDFCRSSPRRSEAGVFCAKAL